MIAALLRRDLARFALGRGGRTGPVLPVLFFVSVAVLFPFAVGPDARILSATGGGVLWIAALLAALLPIDSLIRPDLDEGLLDQFAIRGLAEETVVTIRMAAHWCGFGPGLMAAALPASVLTGVPTAQLATIELGLLIGTPGLAAVGVMVSALTVALRGGGMVSGLIAIPLAIPVLIFGAGTLSPAGDQGLWLLAAASLVLLAVTPFAAGAALRSLRD